MTAVKHPLEVLRVVYTRNVGDSWPLNLRYRVVETNRGLIIQYQRPTWLNFDESEWEPAGPAGDDAVDAIETVNMVCFEANWPYLYYRRIDFL